MDRVTCRKCLAFGEVFGDEYADVSREGILDAEKLGPLNLP